MKLNVKLTYKVLILGHEKDMKRMISYIYITYILCYLQIMFAKTS